MEFFLRVIVPFLLLAFYFFIGETSKNFLPSLLIESFTLCFYAFFQSVGNLFIEQFGVQFCVSLVSLSIFCKVQDFVSSFFGPKEGFSFLRADKLFLLCYFGFLQNVHYLFGFNLKSLKGFLINAKVFQFVIVSKHIVVTCLSFGLFFVILLCY